LEKEQFVEELEDLRAQLGMTYKEFMHAIRNGLSSELFKRWQEEAV